MQFKKLLNTVNFDFGLSKLLPQWRQMFTGKYLFADVSAGITVACIAIPLSLAIALASGAPPEAGLISAIVAGIVCAFFGGTPLSVSGPAAAMSVLLASNVEQYGLKALVFMGLLAGIMQLISGVFGIGKLAKFVPLPVIAGFTAGIGAIILIGQLPLVFGLPAPDQSHIFSVYEHMRDYFHEINLISLGLAATTILIIRGLPKFVPKIPSALVAVVVVTLINYFFALHVTTIGEIPRTLPSPHFPAMPNYPWQSILMGAFFIYLLASLETLLSSSAVDKLSKSEKHNADQELIGQGLGNFAVSLFGGIPVTGVIARSAANVQSGAKTRRASIIHSLIILATVFFIAPLISQIPVAALAGVLFSIAFSMVNYKEFAYFWQISRSEAFIYVTTFFVIIFVDLIAGVQVGILAAIAIMVLRATKVHLQISRIVSDDIVRLALTGSLTFLAIGKVAEIEDQLKTVEPGQTVILDLTGLINLDSSGASSIVELAQNYHRKGIGFYIKGLAPAFEALFKICDGQELLDKYNLISERDLKHKQGFKDQKSYRGRLIYGVRKFYADNKGYNEQLYKHIALNQDPHTLFITCSDSRLVPSMITSSDPGELFIMRNVGNFVPPYSEGSDPSEAAALEFSLTNLEIRDIIICGHSNCGAIKACCDKNPQALVVVPQLAAWIKKIRQQLIHTLPDNNTQAKINEVAKINVLNQIANLKTYPIVQQKMAVTTLNLHAWFFDLDQSLIYEWDMDADEFMPILAEETEE